MGFITERLLMMMMMMMMMMMVMMMMWLLGVTLLRSSCLGHWLNHHHLVQRLNHHHLVQRSSCLGHWLINDHRWCLMNQCPRQLDLLTVMWLLGVTLF